MHNTTLANQSIKEVQRFLASDLEIVNHILQKQLASRLTLINELGLHIVKSGGKRLRPMLVLLMAQALGYEGDKHHLLAAIIELIHTATLLHDDVVDNADLRRSKLSAKKIWGNNASVLVGDFLYSRAFQMIVETESLAIASVLSNTTNVIAEGEVHQLIHQNQINLDEEIFFEIIRCKTAALYEASMHITGLLTKADEETIQTLCALGLNLGIGFQLIDDILDYAEAENTGKEVGNDLNEGKTTLPMIYTLKHTSGDERKQLEEALKSDQPLSGKEVAHCIKMVRESGGLEYTHNKALQYLERAQKTLQTLLPASDYKSTLMTLIAFLENRKY